MKMNKSTISINKSILNSSTIDQNSSILYSPLRTIPIDNVTRFLKMEFSDSILHTEKVNSTPQGKNSHFQNLAFCFPEKKIPKTSLSSRNRIIKPLMPHQTICLPEGKAKVFKMSKFRTQKHTSSNYLNKLKIHSEFLNSKKREYDTPKEGKLINAIKRILFQNFINLLSNINLNKKKSNEKNQPKLVKKEKKKLLSQLKATYCPLAFSKNYLSKGLYSFPRLRITNLNSIKAYRHLDVLDLNINDDSNYKTEIIDNRYIQNFQLKNIDSDLDPKTKLILKKQNYDSHYLYTKSNYNIELSYETVLSYIVLIQNMYRQISNKSISSIFKCPIIVDGKIKNKNESKMKIFVIYIMVYQRKQIKMKIFKMLKHIYDKYKYFSSNEQTGISRENNHSIFESLDFGTELDKCDSYGNFRTVIKKIPEIPKVFTLNNN